MKKITTKRKLTLTAETIVHLKQLTMTELRDLHGGRIPSVVDPVFCGIRSKQDC
jgi:hypothetical protein